MLPAGQVSGGSVYSPPGRFTHLAAGDGHRDEVIKVTLWNKTRTLPRGSMEPSECVATGGARATLPRRVASVLRP